MKVKELMERMRDCAARGSALAAAAGLLLLGVGGRAIAAESNMVTVKGDQSPKGGFSWAQCPAGTQLIGGGYVGGELQAPANVSAPSASHPGAWVAQAAYSYVRAYALCDRKSAPTSAAVGDLVTNGGISYAQCPGNTDLIGGGYATRFGYNRLHQTSDAIEANAPSVVHPGAWAAKSSSGDVAAYALCRARH